MKRAEPLSQWVRLLRLHDRVFLAKGSFKKRNRICQKIHVRMNRVHLEAAKAK
jgi:hypothetical protein